MKLNEFYSKSLSELLKEFELFDIKVNSDDTGIIKTIELKYRPLELRKCRDDPFSF